MRNWVLGLAGNSSWGILTWTLGKWYPKGVNRCLLQFYFLNAKIGRYIYLPVLYVQYAMQFSKFLMHERRKSSFNTPYEIVAFMCQTTSAFAFLSDVVIVNPVHRMPEKLSLRSHLISNQMHMIDFNWGKKESMWLRADKNSAIFYLRSLSLRI